MSGTATAALVAFNLVCTGLETSGNRAEIKTTLPKQTQFTEVYRVDLKRHRWCRNACTQTQPLAGLTDTEITFEQYSDEAIGLANMARVNRETGEYLGFDKIGDHTTLHQGECRRANFTGLPARKF